jgi:CBS domain-containing protein
MGYRRLQCCRRLNERCSTYDTYTEEIMLARDIMTSHPRTATPNEPIVSAAAIMRDLDVGIVPIVDYSTHTPARRSHHRP